MPNCGILYGASGTYKTHNLGLLAKHIFAITKKPTRWITADGGGFMPIKPLVDAEIVIPYIITDDPLRMLMIQRLIEGYWPSKLEDGKRVGKMLLKPDTSNVGAYIFEGTTSIAESLHRLYEGKTTGMKSAYSEVIPSDFVDESNKLLPALTIGSYSMDSFGLIQGLMMKFINYSWTLNVPYVWWSGHEASAEDDLTKKIVRGVALVGNAATPRIGKNVGTMIHAIKEMKEDKTETRYYFQSHPDALLKNVFWEAKTRVPGNKVEALLNTFNKGGYFVPEYEGGLDLYIAREEELLEQGTEEVLKWKEEILKGV
jgi:hypothetical protein